MNLIPQYSSEHYLPRRFCALFYHGVKPTPAVEDHKPNLVEKIGNGLLYIPENAPKFINKICTNPQAINISRSNIWSCAIGMFAVF